MLPFARRFHAFLTALILAMSAMISLPTSGTGAELPRPTGPVLLTVTGKITNTNAPGKAELDRAMLEALGIAKLDTSHSWADGVTHFEGVLASRLLDFVGATGSRIKASAINDYSINLDTAELRRYPVLLAMRMNGADLRLRDRGPLWVVYPRDSFPELRAESHNHKWIWQLKTLEIQ